jgi:hypothetical protein
MSAADRQGSFVIDTMVGQPKLMAHAPADQL